MFAIDTIDLRRLPGRKLFLGIEAPRAGEEPLAAQHFVAARDAAGEIVPSKNALLQSVTRVES